MHLKGLCQLPLDLYDVMYYQHPIRFPSSSIAIMYPSLAVNVINEGTL